MEEDVLSSEEKKSRHFEALCMKILHDEAVDCYRALDRKQRNEKLLSFLTDDEMNELFATDAYCNERKFVAIDTEILVTGRDIADALLKLPQEKRDIILLFYFLELTDGKIAEKLNMPRRTVNHKRNETLELLKKMDLREL